MQKGLQAMELRRIVRIALCFVVWLNAQQVWGADRTPSASTPTYDDHHDLSYVVTPDGTRRPIASVDDWQKRRRHILAGMEAVMGPLPRPTMPIPLETKIVEESHADGYIRRKLTYHTDHPDKRVAAWLLTPSEPSSGRRAAVLCLHPTSVDGKDTAVGLAGRASIHYALELTKRGYITLSPDYPSLGEHDHDFDSDNYVSGSMKAIYDNIRAIDLLESLPEVDSGRIACIGHSLGGHNGLFTAVFDERIQAVVTSCGFTRFNKYMGGDLRGWSGPRYMPLIETEYQLSPERMPFDFAEVIGAIAPRGVFVVAPLGDDNFAVEGVREVVSSSTSVFQLHGKREALRVIYPDYGHDFPDDARVLAYDFLDVILQVKSSANRTGKRSSSTK